MSGRADVPAGGAAEGYLRENLANWDERAQLHATRSGLGYRVQRYVEDRRMLSAVVAFDRPRLGDLRGLRVVHLQCHIGTDTISLARLGARATGLDFSGEAIRQARRLAAETGDRAEFVRASVDRAVETLGAGRFDLVYTGIGALCWLPEIAVWARTVAGLLAPGGRLFLRDAHPVLLAVDEERRDGLVLGYPYFERPEPTRWEGEASYTSTDRPLTATVSYEWNHGLGETVQALLDAGLVLTGLVEHDTLPWEALPGRMVGRSGGEYALAEHPERLPLSFTLQARKPAAGV